MRKLFVSMLLGLPLISLDAFAEVFYFAGNETVVNTGVGPKGPYVNKGLPVSVLVEMTVEGNKIGQRILRMKDSRTYYVSGYQALKVGNAWTMIDHRTKAKVPVSVEMAKDRVKSLVRKQNVGDNELSLSFDMSNPLLFRQETSFKHGNGKMANSTIVDAGIILANQFQDLTKGKKFEPQPPPARVHQGPKKN